jgi:hypothetical protein
LEVFESLYHPFLRMVYYFVYLHHWFITTFVVARLPHYVQTYNVYIYIYLYISLYIYIYHHHRSPVVYSMTSSSSYTGCVIWNWRPLRARDPVLARRSSRSRNGIYHRISQRIVYHGICNDIITAMYIYIYHYMYTAYIYIYRYPTYFLPISIWHWPDHEWQCSSNGNTSASHLVGSICYHGADSPWPILHWAALFASLRATSGLASSYTEVP